MVCVCEVAGCIAHKVKKPGTVNTVAPVFLISSHWIPSLFQTSIKYLLESASYCAQKYVP